MFQPPPTTLLPFEQDNNSKGKASDHNVIIVAPKVDPNYKLERHKKVIHIRPQPTSKVAEFMRDVGTKNWNAVFETEDPHSKAENFHEMLLYSLNKHLVEKTVKMTLLDKPWFNPALKMKFNEMQKEYFKNKKSVKWKKLRKNFRSAKIKACKEFYTQFVTDMKTIKPSLYHKTAKRLGGLNQNAQESLVIECLEGINPKEQVQRVA